MGLEDAIGTDLADEMGAAIMAMDPPDDPQHQQSSADPEAAGSGGSAAGPALPQQQRRQPAPRPRRPAATLQRLLAQLVVVRAVDV
jgi:hypothetical protein